jgi:hypothetical protein
MVASVNDIGVVEELNVQHKVVVALFDDDFCFFWGGGRSLSPLIVDSKFINNDIFSWIRSSRMVINS